MDADVRKRTTWTGWEGHGKGSSPPSDTRMTSTNVLVIARFEERLWAPIALSDHGLITKLSTGRADTGLGLVGLKFRARLCSRPAARRARRRMVTAGSTRWSATVRALPESRSATPNPSSPVHRAERGVLYARLRGG